MTETPEKARLQEIGAAVSEMTPAEPPLAHSTALAALGTSLENDDVYSLAGMNLIAAFPPEVVLADVDHLGYSGVRRLELVRDLLVFLPVLVTWWQLRSALEAYNRSVTQAAQQHTTAVNFLLGWQRGFNHQTWPLSTSAVIVVAIIASVIGATAMAHYWRNQIEKANSRAGQRVELAGLLAEGTVLLSRIRRPATGTFTRDDIQDMVKGFYESSDQLTKTLRDTGTQIQDALQSGPVSRLETALTEWSTAAAALSGLAESLTVPAEILAKMSELERRLAESNRQLTADIAHLVSQLTADIGRLVGQLTDGMGQQTEGISRLITQLGEHIDAAGQEAAAHIQMARNVSDATQEVRDTIDTLHLRLQNLAPLVEELRLAIDRAGGSGFDDHDEWVS
jgi:methyl-accepting chemotaxis protein